MLNFKAGFYLLFGVFKYEALRVMVNGCHSLLLPEDLRLQSIVLFDWRVCDKAFSFSSIFRNKQ